MILKDVCIFHDHLRFFQRVHFIIISVQSCSTPKCWWSVEDELVVVWWYGSRVKGTRHLTSITDAQQMGTSDDVGSLNHPLQSFPVSDVPRQDAFYCSSVKVLLVFFFLPLWWMCKDHDIFSVAFISAVLMQLSNVRPCEAAVAVIFTTGRLKMPWDDCVKIFFLLANLASIW